MSLEAAVTILAVSVIFLIGSVITLAIEFNSYKRAQRTTIALQLSQQLALSPMAQAIDMVRALGTPSMNGHGPAPAPAALANDQLHAVKEVNQYFSHVGELVRTGMANDEVFALMGPTISEMWHAAKSYRVLVAAKAPDKAPCRDDFDYLYEAWLNYDHRRRAECGGLSL
jgi:hypothetical protein